MNDTLTQFIQQAFAAHGIQASVANGWTSVQDLLRTRAIAEVKNRQANGFTIQLDVITEAPALGASAPLIDRFAGMGDSEEAAVKNAFEKYLRGSFHVIAEALTPHQCDQTQVDWLHWENANGRWRVCSGPLLTFGTGTCSIASQYEPVLHQLRDAFLASAQPGPHWLHAYIGFLDGKLAGSELIRDGNAWEAAMPILQQGPWSPTARYESIRHLIIALPVNEAQGAEQVSNKPWWRLWS